MKKVVNVQRDPFLLKSQSSLPIKELKLPWWPTSIRKAPETPDSRVQNLLSSIICPQLMDFRVGYYDEVNSIKVN